MAGTSGRTPTRLPRSHQSSPINTAAAAPTAPGAPASPALRFRPGSSCRSTPSVAPAQGESHGCGPAPQHEEQAGQEFFRSSHGDEQQNSSRWFTSALNVCFSLISCVIFLFAAAAAARIWLPKHQPLRNYADQLLTHAPRLGSLSLFRLTPVLQQAAAAAAKDGHTRLSELLYTAADYPLTDGLFLLLFSLCLILFFFFLLHGLRAYKRDRDVEMSPPATMYCANMMTPEEFANRQATYKALAELMKDPEYLQLKGTRTAAGPEAWNWQLRAQRDPSELLQEELAETSGEE